MRALRWWLTLLLAMTLYIVGGEIRDATNFPTFFILVIGVVIWSVFTTLLWRQPLEYGK